MSQVPIYRIVEWEEKFENYRTKRMKTLNWIPQRVSFEGDRIRALLRLGGTAGYGTFRIICAVAAVCEPRGTLMTGMGTPHTPQSLADKTGVPASDFEIVLDMCVKLKLIEISGHREVNQEEYPRVGTQVVSEYPEDTNAVPLQGAETEGKKEQKEQQQKGAPRYPRGGTRERKNAAAVSFQENQNEEISLSKVVHELRSIGMDTRAIPQLTASHPYPKILDAIAMVKARGDGIKNPAGLVRAALEEDYETAKPQSDYEKNRAKLEETEDKKLAALRSEEADFRAERLKRLETLAALPPAEFEDLKVASYNALPEVTRLRVEEDSDPLKNAFWLSSMWVEFNKRDTASQSDELIPGGW